MAKAWSEFPALHTQDPTPPHPHTHTLIFLHGRGSNGLEVADDFLSAKLSSGLMIPEALPNWRFVFPSSQERWNSTFEEGEDAWFDIASLTDVERKKELQLDCLGESLKFVIAVIRDEIEKVDGDAGRVVLGGVSMGMATAIWSLFYYCFSIRGHLEHRKMLLGGFIGFSGWLPFWSDFESIANEHRSTGSAADAKAVEEASWFVASRVGFADARSDGILAAGTEIPAEASQSLLSVPVFLGHGRDDAYVDVALGQKVARVLGQEGLGMTVRWKEYEGAESEGHWLKEPEEFDDAVCVLEGNEWLCLNS